MVILSYAVEAFLATYGNSGLKTLKIIIRYLKFKKERYGKDSPCFTYEALRKFITYERLNIKFTTLERSIRKLAEDGVIKRIVKRKGKDVFFCLDTDHPIVNYLMG